VHAVDGVVRLVLDGVEDVGIVLEQVDVDRLDEPPRTSRRLASPDAEITSNCSGLVENSVYASSDVPKICGLTLHRGVVWKS
jgi:hypothetical protein